jgi:S-adenosylmethionine:tRNA ribosyltransferase-isomerase
VGTFRPVDAERPEEGELHAERYRVSPGTARRLNRVRETGGRVWAVGTTSTRVLETVAAPADGRLDPGGDDGPARYHAAEGETDLFIHPPHDFRGVDRLITNFHLPRSSLLMLVAAFAGRELTAAAYRHAVDEGYRFYSYGDATLWT